MHTIALIRIWNHTQQHSGTSGARVCAAVLLGLYNGARFPMDITDLRTLDAHLLNDCLMVITADSVRCQKEVHEWLNCLSGRYDFSERFEALAHEYKTFAKGKCGKRGDYAHVTRLVVEEPIPRITVTSLQGDMQGDFTMEAHAEMLARNSGVGKLGVPMVDMGNGRVPAGDVWFRQYDPVTGRVLNAVTAQLQERRVSDDPSPYFNDLAG